MASTVKKYSKLWVQPHPASDAFAVVGAHPTAELADGSNHEAYFELIIPGDFNPVSATNPNVFAYVYVMQTVTAAGPPNMQRLVTTEWANAGEAYNTHTDTIAQAAVSLTQNLITEDNITTALDAAALDEGDILGVTYQRIGGDAGDTVEASVYVLGMVFYYY